MCIYEYVSGYEMLLPTHDYDQEYEYMAFFFTCTYYVHIGRITKHIYLDFWGTFDGSRSTFTWTAFYSCIPTQSRLII